MSLRVLDLLCSSILARPSSTPSIQGDEYETDAISSDGGKDVRTLALRANYESSAIIEIIVQNCAKSSNLDIKSAETYLQMLREWSQALPAVLRRSPKNSHETQATVIGDRNEVAIGNIHVSCTYYFGVILVTRQFLISSVMSELRGRRSPKNAVSPIPSAEDEAQKEKIKHFSKGCISSAAFMAQLCYEASTNNILLDNMCLMKYVPFPQHNPLENRCTNNSPEHGSSQPVWSWVLTSWSKKRHGQKHAKHSIMLKRRSTNYHVCHHKRGNTTTSSPVSPTLSICIESNY